MIFIIIFYGILITAGLSITRTKILQPKLLRALTIYHRNTGDSRVPPSYYCGAQQDHDWPEDLVGFELGKNVIELRRRHALASEEEIHALDSIGFVWQPRNHDFDIIYKSLSVFKEHNRGILHVPQAFVIPKGGLKNPYPREAWGLPLGKRCKSIREGRAYSNLEYSVRLDQLGFVWNPRELRRDKVAEREMEFVLEDGSSEWSFQWSERVNEHDHFDESTVETRAPVMDRDQAFRIFKLALDCFRLRHGHVCVPLKFVVPAHADEGREKEVKSDHRQDTHEPWPEELRGYPLGNTVNSVRKGRSFARLEQAMELDAMGFVWSVRERRLALLLKALECYKAVHGIKHVPRSCVVDSALLDAARARGVDGLPDMAAELEGFSLGIRLRTTGKRLSNMKVTPDIQERIEEMGICL